MSWHFLQGPEAASWEGGSSGGVPCALSRLIPTPGVSCLPDRLTGPLSRSPSGMTLRRSTATHGAATLMWFQGDSPVRTYHLPEKAQDWTVLDLDCGPRWHESLARCNPPMSGWKTRQCSLLGGLTEFSGILPRWGTMRDGECFPLPTLEHPTSERGCGYWPTPTKTVVLAPKGVDQMEHWKKRKQDYKEGKSKFDPGLKLEMLCGGVPNPVLVEWLMGWPMGWTELQPLETGKFRQWLDLHGTR